jgi:uncharacterized lipoprotein NlpE involved in copper resistance
MKKMIMNMVLAVALFIGGCAVLDQALVPEEGKIKSDTVRVVDAVAVGLATTGNPYAVPVLAGSTLLSVVAGAYTNMRKKQALADADDKAAQAKIVTESIVMAIEDVSGTDIGQGTIGDIIKGKVEEKLRDNDSYIIGKAIIDALKEGA